MELAQSGIAAVGIGLIGTTFAFGLRHGIDWDHIAAITDIAGSQETGRRGLLLSSMYALGHAVVVFVLGVLAIVFAERLPDGLDVIMGRIVGLTLLLLGGFILVGLIRKGRNFRMRSRWMVVFSMMARAVGWARRQRDRQQVEIVHAHDHAADEPHDEPDGAPARGGSSQNQMPATAGTRVSTVDAHRHPHRHLVTLPDDPFANYGVGTATLVGMIHGIGAETPTQLLIFVTAAGVAGAQGGLLLLLVFLAGLFTSNTAIALAASFGFLSASRSWPVYVAVAVLTGVFSFVVGGLFLFGQGDLLPAFFGN